MGKSTISMVKLHHQPVMVLVLELLGFNCDLQDSCSLGSDCPSLSARLVLGLNFFQHLYRKTFFSGMTIDAFHNFWGNVDTVPCWLSQTSPRTSFEVGLGTQTPLIMPSNMACFELVTASCWKAGRCTVLCHAFWSSWGTFSDFKKPGRDCFALRPNQVSMGLKQLSIENKWVQDLLQLQGSLLWHVS